MRVLYVLFFCFFIPANIFPAFYGHLRKQRELKKKYGNIQDRRARSFQERKDLEDLLCDAIHELNEKRIDELLSKKPHWNKLLTLPIFVLLELVLHNRNLVKERVGQFYRIFNYLLEAGIPLEYAYDKWKAGRLFAYMEVTVGRKNEEISRILETIKPHFEDLDSYKNAVKKRKIWKSGYGFW